MSFFDGLHHEVVQTLDAEVAFSFPSPPPNQIFPPCPATISFVDDNINYKGEVKWLSVAPRSLFAETIAMNGIRVGVARGAFTVAKNSLGGLCFEFISASARVEGFLNNWVESSAVLEYSPEYEMTVPTLEEISEQLKFRFQ